MPEGAGQHATFWLTCATVGSARERDRLLDALEADDIEARPVWKPMHLQPVFAGCKTIGSAVAERLFEEGICLPSGSGITEAQRELVIARVREASASG